MGFFYSKNKCVFSSFDVKKKKVLNLLHIYFRSRRYFELILVQFLPPCGSYKLINDDMYKVINYDTYKLINDDTYKAINYDTYKVSNYNT